MTNPLPIGCADRYNEIIRRAGELGETFCNGNRNLMLHELLDMEPKAALAVLAVMMAHTKASFRDDVKRYLLEVA